MAEPVVRHILHAWPGLPMPQHIHQGKGHLGPGTAPFRPRGCIGDPLTLSLPPLRGGRLLWWPGRRAELFPEESWDIEE